MAKLALSQLEKATAIPAGSLHLVEMGDGSGTKTVTQETLVKETGNALKVGDLKELQTENKKSIVEAINEVAQSGGGGTSVDILDSKEEIEANTEPEKVAGAMAVKEMFGALNDNLQFPDGIRFYPDVKDGVRGYNTDPQRGADTFCPFSNFQKQATILNSKIQGSPHSVTINNARQYKVLFASFWCATIGKYSLSCTGAEKVCEWGDNSDGQRHNSAVFFPTEDVVTITGYKSLYVCGVK